MTLPHTAQDWQNYLKSEWQNLKQLLYTRGYTLNDHQPHTQGERFLMQNLTTAGGQKLILLGSDQEGTKVVIKATRDNAGKAELQHERHCRQSLHAINFAYQEFHSPAESAFFEADGFLISIQEFIDQKCTYIERPIAEQFSFALQAFKTQESARATTKGHYKIISRVFGIRSSEEYLKLYNGFSTFLSQNTKDSRLLNNIEKVGITLEKQRDRIEQYCGFLTHTDFVPHNFRIKDQTLYLLDFSSLQFGNKHESWARFLNFMTLYNHELEMLLIEYIENNRSTEERESLQLMRLYRLTEIITYYARTLQRSEGELKQLNEARVAFWHHVLQAELENKRVSRNIVISYQKTRDRLRSEGEKQRQQDLH